ncbi:MAG: hypothetical protein HGA80_08770 [Candidatus Omnitrophica bacterium]|nr:hypothetical protein [Candidatus Omnitrophota bacterium]
MAKQRKSVKKAGELKKSLKDFLADEDGYVSKETVLKLGLGTVAGLGALGALANAQSHTNHAHHANVLDYGLNVASTECPVFGPTHNNIPGHTSHSSY